MLKGSSSSVRVFYPSFDRAQLVEVLKKRLVSLSSVLPVKKVFLVGSWAQGRQTAFSDIDLIVIYDDPPREDAYRLVRDHVRLRGLEPHVFSEEESKRLKPTIDRMTQKGIVLFPS